MVSTSIDPFSRLQRPVVVNAALLIGALAVMTMASKIIPRESPATIPPGVLLRRGAAFQGCILAAAAVIVFVNVVVLGNSARALWRPPIAGASQSVIALCAFSALSVVVLIAYIAATRPASLQVNAQTAMRYGLVPLLALSNATSEEVMTRFTVLHFGPGTSSVAKIAISATAFGLLHLTSGTPSGWVGFGLTFVLGAVAMAVTIDTGSMRYALALHVLLDVVIFSTLVAQLPR